MFILIAVLSVLALLWGAVSLLGIVYPFRPFRTRSRAAKSLGGSFVAVIAGTIYIGTNSQPQASRPAPTAQAPSVETADAEPAAPSVPTPDAQASAPAVAPERLAVAAPTVVPPAEPQSRFVEADFYWEPSSDPYRAQIVAVVNKIARENRNCPDPDPQTVALSQSRSAPNDPVFFVTCGSGANVFNVWFRPSDAEGDVTFTAVQPVSQRAATDACETVARNAATHPSTVDFSRVLDLSYFAHANGNVRLTSTFTAQNAFGLELKYDIYCFFEGNRLTEHSITEAVR